jgi:hypothetical protein
MKGKYSARAKCRNCKTEEVVEIDKGIPMLTYEPNVKCDYCGCNVVLVPIQE